MSVNRQRLIDELATAGLAPNHRLGQNFMIDGGAVTRLVAALDLRPGERVLEVGPGTGLLTEAILATGAQVLAIELDAGLHALLAQRHAGNPALTLVHGDCLETKNRLHPAIRAFAEAGPWKLGANLPYDASLPLLLGCLALERPPVLGVVTVQYEAAARLCSAPGGDAWGASAVVAQASGDGRILGRLGPRSFHPQPRVDSAILRWEPRRRLPPGFPAFVRAVFASRRKVAVRALRDRGFDLATAQAACDACGLAAAARIENLTVDQLLRLHAAAGEPPCAAS